MKIIIWNYRGLGNPRAVRASLRLISLENPNVLFLMETQLKQEELRSIQHKSGFHFCHGMNCSGKGRDKAGDLALLWDDMKNLTITYFSINHVSDFIMEESDDQKGFFNGVYGFLEEQNKRRTSQLIQDLERHEAIELFSLVTSMT